MKLAVVFVICFIATQNVVFTATPEDAHKELTLLIQIATNQSTLATHALNSAGSIVKDLETEVINVGSRNVLNEYAKITTEFNQIVQSAEKIGVNITKCTKNQWDVLEQVHHIAALDVIACSNRFSTSAQNVLEKGLGQVVNVVSDVYEYENELAQCQSNSACLDSVLAEIRADQLDIPRKVHEEMNYALTRAEANKLKLIQCEVAPATSVIQHGATIIKDIQNCADQIIEGSSRPPF